MEDLKEFVRKKGIGKLLEDVCLREYTTYRVGGICRYMVFPKTTRKLIMLIRYLREYHIPMMVLGFGSNVLFSDDPYEGVIIKLDAMDNVDFIGNKVKVGSGASLMKVASMAVRRGLSGLEFATGIPGSIGGAVYMNAGAYKSDMGYIVKTVKVLTPDLKVITMVNREMDFHYRSSFLQKHKDYICLEAILKLKPGNREEMEELVKERKKRRLESQPLEYPSAGSVFRNPEGDYAGRLIEELGYKGLIKGGAQVSVKHANFIINLGTATAADIRGLIEFIQDSVFEKYHISLKVEQEFVNWE